MAEHRSSLKFLLCFLIKLWVLLAICGVFAWNTQSKKGMEIKKPSLRVSEAKKPRIEACTNLFSSRQENDANANAMNNASDSINEKNDDAP